MKLPQDFVTKLHFIVSHVPVFVSPTGNIYQEKCVCPNNLKEWLSAMECPSSYSQIKRDLSLFPSVDMTTVAKEAIERFNQKGRHSLCHYVVKDNKVGTTWHNSQSNRAPGLAYCLCYQIKLESVFSLTY